MLNILLQDSQEGTQVLADGESVEKTLSIIELIGSGGTAGQIIIGVLFMLLMVALYIYFEQTLICFIAKQLKIIK